MKSFLARYSVPLGIVIWILVIIFGYNYHWMLGVAACVLPIILMTLIA